MALINKLWPNKRRATPSDTFSTTTRRVEAIFPANFVVNRLSRMTTLHSFRLVGQKNGSDSDNLISVNRPWLSVITDQGDHGIMFRIPFIAGATLWVSTFRSLLMLPRSLLMLPTLSLSFPILVPIEFVS